MTENSFPVEDDFLRAFPQDAASHLAKLLRAFDDREEVVSGELAHLAGEHRASVRKQNLRFTEAARIKQDLAWCWMTRVILQRHSKVERPERNPSSLATPTRLNELAAEGEGVEKCLASPGSALFLEPRDELD